MSPENAPENASESGTGSSRLKKGRISRSVYDALLPPLSRTVSEWAEEKRVLGPHCSSNPGPWRNDYTPYLVEPMDLFGGFDYPRVVMMTSAQVGKSEAGLNAILRTIDDDPGPIMFVLPNEGLATDWSRGRLRAGISNVASVAAAVPKSNSRKDGSVTMLNLHFNGGFLRLVGAQSASGLASSPIRVLYLDEIDHYPASAGEEGDPVNLAEARTTSFRDRAIMYTSTPVVKGNSRIEDLFESGDKRRWHCDCEDCGHRWVWNFFEHVKFEGRDPKTARLLCPGCGALHDQAAADRMSAAGRWIATEAHPKQTDLASFHIWSIHARWVTMADIVGRFLDARAGKSRFQTFYNLVLGESFVEQGDGFKEDEAQARGRKYTPDTLPPEVLLLTAAVDVQKDRLELYVAGWNDQQGHYGVVHEVFTGDTTRGATWKPLAEMLKRRRFHTTDGRALRVSAVCTDTSYRVVAACRGASLLAGSMPVPDNSIAIRGSHRADSPVLGKQVRTAVRKDGVDLSPNLRPRYWVGVSAVKDIVDLRMRRNVSEGGWVWGDAFGNRWFKQLAAERRVERMVQGRRQRIWVKREGHNRNEALDLCVYAYAAMGFIRPKWASFRRGRADKQPAGDNISGEQGDQPLTAAQTPQSGDAKPVPGVKRRRRKRRVLTIGAPAGASRRPGRPGR